VALAALRPPSTSPSIAIIGGKPTIAWTETSDATTNIRVAQFDVTANNGAGAWLALGDSLSGNGISDTGTADQAVITDSSFGPVVAWLDSQNGTAQVYAKVFTNGSWMEIGTGSAQDGGVSGASANTSLEEVAIAAGTGRMAISWTQLDPSGMRQVYLKEFNGSQWQQIADSSSNAGVSGSLAATYLAPVTNNLQPTLAYVGNDLFVAWQTFVDESSLIATIRYATGVPSVAHLVETLERPADPQLASNGTQLQLAWLDGESQIYTMRWNGATFQESVPGDASGTGVTPTGRVVSQLALSLDATGRPTIVWEDASLGRSAIMARSQLLPTGAVHIANPGGPSIQQILAANTLSPGDVIYVVGQHTDNIAVGPDDAGVTIVGAPGSTITGDLAITANQVHLQNLTIVGQVTLTGSIQSTVRDSLMTGKLTISGGSGNQVVRSRVNQGGIVLSGNTVAAIIRNSQIVGGVNAVSLGDPNNSSTGGAQNVTLLDNALAGANTGVRVVASSSGVLSGNQVIAVSTGLALDVSFDGWIRNNQFSGATVGVRYDSATRLSDNDIHGNVTGVIATVDSTITGLGFDPSTLPNRIYSNATGVQLIGRLQNQRIYANHTGIASARDLDSLVLDRGNTIENNNVGVNATGNVRFQKIERNGIGIMAANQQLISHNQMIGNAVGISIASKTNTKVINNTIYTDSGDNIRVTAGSSLTEIRNNILWTKSGYNLYVANDQYHGIL
jgi:nitrous oxidase accessory protein NosD